MKSVIVILSVFGLGCAEVTYAAPLETRNALPQANAAAVRRSLKFLAEIQKSDGRWESLPGEPASLLAVHGRMTMVLTAVSGLALLAEGSTTTSGTYQKQIVAARDYLLQLIGDSSNFTLPEYADGIIKTHIANEVPFMLVFLNEIYCKEREPRLRVALQQVADYIAKAQHAEGGWDYTYTNSRHGHTATAIQNVFALALLKKSGVTVADETTDRGLGFIRGREPSAQDKPGYLLYGDGGKETPLEPGVTNRAAGTLVMLYHLNQMSDRLWDRSNMYHRQALSEKYIYGGHSPAYQHFTVSTASSLLGDASWRTYMDAFGRSHLEAQGDNGQWPTTRGNSDRSHPHGGIVFETAITSMLLQFPLKHLSFATRQESSGESGD